MRCFSAYSSFVLRQTHLECLLPKSSILVSSDQSTRSQLKSQCRLANSRRLRLWVLVRKGFFLACLPNSLLACREPLMVVLETLWPQDATLWCNSVTVSLGLFFYFSYHPPHCALWQDKLGTSSSLVCHCSSCFKLLNDSSDCRYGQVKASGYFLVAIAWLMKVDTHLPYLNGVFSCLCHVDK